MYFELGRRKLNSAANLWTGRILVRIITDLERGPNAKALQSEPKRGRVVQNHAEVNVRRRSPRRVESHHGPCDNTTPIASYC